MRQDFDPPAGSRHSLCRAQASAHDPQAVEKLLKDLGDTPMSLVILFVSPDTDFAAFVSRFRAYFLDTDVVACTPSPSSLWRQ